MCSGSPADDVAYFIVGAPTLDDRRANERDLLDHHCQALLAAASSVTSSAGSSPGRTGYSHR
jgi:hypothetical protein